MSTRTITITDPRDFDGDPYQVAARAVEQAASIAKLLSDNLTAVNLMARNAELERCLASGIDGDDLRRIAQGWSESPQGRMFPEITDDLAAIQRRLGVLKRAASYDPKTNRTGRSRVVR